MPANAVVDAIEPPAFYGKLPAHGDFVGRGLSAAQELAIDRWLAGWIAAARSEWEDEFAENYRTAQPWLFGGERVSAIAIPSADRVGRLFPLLATVPAAVELQALYDTVVTGIGKVWDGDQLFTALGEMVGETDAEAEARGWFVPDAERCAMPHPLKAMDSGAVGAMLA